jgi:hypothetical protein
MQGLGLLNDTVKSERKTKFWIENMRECILKEEITTSLGFY